MSLILVGFLRCIKPELTKNANILTSEDVLLIMKISAVRFDLGPKE